MANIFFPSCKAKASYPQASKQLAKYIENKYAIDPIGCCKVNHKKLTKDDTAILVCLNCARVIEKNGDFDHLEFIWDIIDQDETFNFPNYHQQRMTIQDCHLVSNRPKLKQTIRSLLKKMNIQVVEYDMGENHHCPSYEIVGYHLDHKLNEEEKKQYFSKQYDNIDTDIIVSYCKYCNDGVNYSHKTGKHILELLFPTN
ncbi:hypothetical protein [Thomasclavelia sp.]|uniref:hypothetical protein n=1 Tax=Thomasclavelia sp. TaxID=3025757 RepID=UPI0025CC62CC|nr:hypothetical protein [Thomasclavelia sp.]